ncbi:ATP-grasp domain-containing protein [Labilibacter sediminis]|nr:ATP-grasp domain-containing protein [Labilibacter sediminis]
MNNKDKKILILPALFDHIDIINEAKKQNYKVITCDNVPENPGHKYADESADISLLDIDKLVQFARKNDIDAVSAFSTDIGSLAAAYITDQLNLPGNSLETVSILVNKYRFRCFLKQKGFNCPTFQIAASFEEISQSKINYPSIIKPVDRAGSKGVYKVNNIDELKHKIEKSLSYSFEKRVIIEDYIETDIQHIHGDAIVQNGELIFCCLGDQYFGRGVSRFSPVATVIPSNAPQEFLVDIENNLKRIITEIGYFNGGLNIEVRVDKQGKPFFVEVAPRFGGNFIPTTIGIARGIDIVKCAFDIAVGKKVDLPPLINMKHIFQFSLRSDVEGVFDQVHILRKDRFKILKSFPVKKSGEQITLDNGPSNIISVYIIQAINNEVVKDIIENPFNYFNVEIE